ncbi:MAG: IS200/IS605 family transposase [Candidatus Peribacteraceae bacterium]|jgi:putative transposase|nr:IS200/IS605 family transposase [Candidatus Peribacteraceae bacterium]MDP7454321.1 IS200/IS605 family transposase [Candidatus Peribacteraceae bacterium]MDP7645719.1 IS200/IS605 family transposase [Candidatus Peribacteraceae bacterium]|tara:strand:- start:1 stop:438 length:438 start_codon:yes stop_codon:yes gene_type:complete
MRSFKAQSHVMWDCKYHIVIVPKYRKKVLYGTARVEIGTIIRELAKQKEVEVIEGTACPDHMHMILSIPPKHSVAYIMGFLKGKSAIRAHNTFARKRSVSQKSFWSRGYFVSTVGIDEDIIRKYVQDQWKNDQFFDGPELDLHWD